MENIWTVLGIVMAADAILSLIVVGLFMARKSFYTVRLRQLGREFLGINDSFELVNDQIEWLSDRIERGNETEEVEADTEEKEDEEEEDCCCECGNCEEPCDF